MSLSDFAWDLPDDLDSSSGSSTDSTSSSSSSTDTSEPNLDPDAWLSSGSSDGATMEESSSGSLNDEILRQRQAFQTSGADATDVTTELGGQEQELQAALNIAGSGVSTGGASAETQSAADRGAFGTDQSQDQQAPPTAEEFNEQKRQEFIEGQRGDEGAVGGLTARAAQSGTPLLSQAAKGVRANVYDYTVQEGADEVSQRADRAASGPLGAADELTGSGADYVFDNPSVNVQRGVRRTYNAATGQTGERGATEDLSSAFQAVSSTGQRGVRALREGNEVRYSAFGQEVSVDAGGLNPEAGGVSAADVGEFGRRAFIEDPARGVSRTVLGVDPRSGERNVDPRGIDVAETAFSATGTGSVVRGAARAGSAATTAGRAGAPAAASAAARLGGRGATDGVTTASMSAPFRLFAEGARRVGTRLGGRLSRRGSSQVDNLPVVRDPDEGLPTRPENLNIRSQGQGPIEVEQTASAQDNLPQGPNSIRTTGQGTPFREFDATRSAGGGPAGIQADFLGDIDGTVRRLTSRGEPEVPANRVRGDQGANAPAEGGNNLPVPASQSETGLARANQVSEAADEGRGIFGQAADSLRTISPVGGGSVASTVRRLTPSASAADDAASGRRFADEATDEDVARAVDEAETPSPGRFGDDTRTTSGDGTTTRSTTSRTADDTDAAARTPDEAETPSPGGARGADEAGESVGQRIRNAVDDALGRGGRTTDDAADEGGGLLGGRGRLLGGILGGAALGGAGAIAYSDLNQPQNISGDGWRASKEKTYRDSSGQPYGVLYEVRSDNGSPLGYTIIVGVGDDGTIYYLSGVETPESLVSDEKAKGLARAQERAASQANVGGGQ